MTDDNAHSRTIIYGIINDITRTASITALTTSESWAFEDFRYESAREITNPPVVDRQVSLWQIDPPEPRDCDTEALYEKFTKLKKENNPKLREIELGTKMAEFRWLGRCVQVLLHVRNPNDDSNESVRKTLSSEFVDVYGSTFIKVGQWRTFQADDIALNRI
ncbi:hypothetical protein SCHPADRAFT_131557 [Schizopora paradoxa]|uniref:Uncharacterized protein n=1 Tax=Schizopora paradoxa TaxID=27342 RepID=A0A0H2S289_9AGAM|nr:hypothetical protein SCHPADRAFT_131557 [Schizopora paradoxa]